LQAKNYIVAKGTPLMKSGAIVIQLGVAFNVYYLVNVLYMRRVCAPRIHFIPPSPIKDKILKDCDNQVPSDRGDRNSSIASKMAERGSALTEVQRQEPDDEQIDYNNHQTDVNIKSFDEDNNTHLNENGKEFDYSKSYSLPPAEAPSKVVRRNKYGDIIEDV
jgi:hypothetical protein